MTYSKYHSVIFDLDGVIIDSYSVMEKAFKYAFKQFFPYQDPPIDEFIKHMGQGFLTIMNSMHLPVEMHPYFIQKSIDSVDEITLFPEIKSLLELLKNSSRYLGIATGKDSFRTQQLLHNKDLFHYFNDVICSDQIKQGKPHPESLNFHIKQADLDKATLVFIGDSTADIKCAKNAGVLSIAALWGMGRKEDLIKEQPDYMASDIQELKELLLSKVLIKK